MATALKHKLSYHRRLFLLLLVFSWTLVGCFILFQYGREKHFKAERLDAQLQLFNLRMLDAVNAGAQSVLVMSGETDEAILKASDVQPKYVLHDVAELAQILRGGATA
jgi:hypothetical protein